MVELPAGTVTLLFSDIEGSTGLVRTLGPWWGDTLDQQRALCRSAWRAHGGHELGTEGDSFFVAFATASAAVGAARDVQRAMSSATWPEDASVRIRIGLHTGTPQRHADGYIGLDVHKAARIAGAAHGGQVLLSEATAHLVRDELADSEGLLDLGEHQLKDIPHRIRLYQLAGPGLPHEFPSPRTQGGAGNLPPQLTPTVGRYGELDELAALLARGARLVTLTGTGGSGKTRLAVTLGGHVATDYAGGVYFVPLESATAASDAWASIAQTLGLRPEQPSATAVADGLSAGATLLVLDNLEQIDDADQVCRELLLAAPGVSIVATSRRALHVEGEHEHAVPPLDVPSLSAGDISGVASVQMFVHLAQAAHREFRLTPDNAPIVARLCIALDGMPLALELVAARTKLLSLHQLLDRVDRTIDLVHTDRSRHARQRTIRDTIAWSYRLLVPAQQAALQHLATFESGADLAGVEGVLSQDVVAGSDPVVLLYDLVDASLVHVSATESGEPRYRLLETVKQFAREEADAASDLADAQRAHAQYFYDWAKALVGPREWADQGPHHALLAELDNIRAVVARGASGIHDSEWYGDRAVPAQHVIALFAEIAFLVSRYELALRWAREGLDLTGIHADDSGRAALHLVCCECLIRLDQPVLAIQHGVSTRSPLRPPHELPRWADPYLVAVEAEAWVSSAHLELGDLAGAKESANWLYALARPGDEAAAHAIMDVEFHIAYELGDFDRAHEFLERLADFEEARGFPPRRRTLTVNNLADVDMRRGRFREAQERLATWVDVSTSSPFATSVYAATFAAVIGKQHPLLCARTYGALETFREVEAIPHTPRAHEEDERALSSVRSLVPVDDWNAAWQRGRAESVADLLSEMARLPLPPA